jgi:integrase
MTPLRAAPDLGRAIGLFQTTMLASGKAPSTAKAYTDSLMLLEKVFGTYCDPKSILVDDLEAIISTWRLGATTKRNRIIAWRQFWKWGSKRYGWPDVAGQLSIPRRDRPALRRLTSDEVHSMLMTSVVERARTTVWVLAYSALRVGELIELRWADIDLEASRITVAHQTAKGRKGRIVPIPDELTMYLARVATTRGPNAADDCYVIPHRRRAQFIPEDEATIWTKRTSQMSVGRILKGVATAAALRAPGEITAHMFRRFYLEQLLEAEPNIYIAMAIAGHSSMQTTAEYGGGASLGAATRSVQGLSFQGVCDTGTLASSAVSDGRTWDRTKAESREPETAVESDLCHPLVTPYGNLLQDMLDLLMEGDE